MIIFRVSDTIRVIGLGLGIGLILKLCLGICYQKDCTRSRSVTVHSDLSCDASRAHRRGRGDKTKN